MTETATTTESCTCPKCVAICNNPGWMTPEEAEAAIDAGLGPRLMVDWMEPCDELKNDKRVYILCPASRGYEGSEARDFDFAELIMMSIGDARLDKGRCNFLKDSRCELHDTPHKPRQCRECFGCKPDGPDNYEMGRLWNTEAAQLLVQKWREACGCC